MTKIMKCDCDHKFQDEKYGRKNRVFNQTSKSSGIIFRCSVCRSEKAGKIKE